MEDRGRDAGVGSASRARGAVQRTRRASRSRGDVHERRGETRAVLGGEDDDGRRRGRAAHALERVSRSSRRGCAPHGPAGPGSSPMSVSRKGGGSYTPSRVSSQPVDAVDISPRGMTALSASPERSTNHELDTWPKNASKKQCNNAIFVPVIARYFPTGFNVFYGVVDSARSVGFGAGEAIRGSGLHCCPGWRP